MAYGKLLGTAGKNGMPLPFPAGRVLPVVINLAIGADREDLKAAILVMAYSHLLGISAKGCLATPATTT